jgi:hypothetical protein
MQLTKDEIREKINLIDLRDNHQRFFSQDEFLRLRYLTLKEHHNTCSNPFCIGHEGGDIETNCPICGHLLNKTMK